MMLLANMYNLPPNWILDESNLSRDVFTLLDLQVLTLLDLQVLTLVDLQVLTLLDLQVHGAHGPGPLGFASRVHAKH
jgi:hypothetical protein